MHEELLGYQTREIEMVRADTGRIPGVSIFRNERRSSRRTMIYSGEKNLTVGENSLTDVATRCDSFSPAQQEPSSPIE